MSSDSYLLISRIGLVLIFVGLIWMAQGYKKTYVRRFSINYNLIDIANKNKRIRLVKILSGHPVFKLFALKPGSNEYIKIGNLIRRAGGADDFTPELYHTCRIGFVLLIFIFYFGYHFLRLFTYAVLGHVAHIASVSISHADYLFLLAVLVVTYFIPYFYILFTIKKRQIKLTPELYSIGPFAVTMLESRAYGAYEIIQTLADTMKFLRPYMLSCLNEFYINPYQAIQNMAVKVGDDNFQAICNGLKQAIDMDKQYAALFMQQHLDQINRMRVLQREAKIKKKPLIYVFLLAPPMISIIAIWIYPWIVRAMTILGGPF